MRSSSAPAAGDGTSPPGQCAGTLALDCLLPGPPSVTVSSHGHRRLAPPQDRRPRAPPRLPAPLSAVLMQRGSLPRARPSPRSPRAAVGAGPAHARTALAAPAARGADVSLTVPPPRLQGNRGFRLLLWEPEVTVYSHGRPAARPRSPPRRVLPALVWADAEQEEAGRRRNIRCVCGGGRRCAQRGGLRGCCASTPAQKQARSAECLTILLSDCPVFPVEVSAT